MSRRTLCAWSQTWLTWVFLPACLLVLLILGCLVLIIIEVLHRPRGPGHEYCGSPFKDAPRYHLMDQHGCGENDPNGPFFDPVHGVIHHFFQDHLGAPPGGGPVYGHFVSKDFVHWAQIPVAIWNGLDASETPPRKTSYDTRAIYTGSAVIVDGAGPGGKGPGVVHIYPGLCVKNEWGPNCTTGVLLAQAVPADYAGDELLTKWTKPSYNPIVEKTQRDPSTPWKTPDGEWRLRTYDSKVYSAASDSDLIAGRWKFVGQTKDFRTCECPSLYPLPPSTPGFEKEYAAAKAAGALPSHVHKTSCGGDWWQLGTYYPGEKGTTGRFSATPGWEDTWRVVKLDYGNYYASKDSEYPSKSGKMRRINWGWAQVKPDGTQSMPREITFNAAVRRLQQAPIEEMTDLRGPAAFASQGINLTAGASSLDIKEGVAIHSETVATFQLPDSAASFGVDVGGTACQVDFAPPPNKSVAYFPVPVNCAGVQDVMRLTPAEKTLEIRVFADMTIIETYFQAGRVAMTKSVKLLPSAAVRLVSDSAIVVTSVEVFPMQSIWVSEEEVRKAPRVYSKPEAVVYA